MFTHHTVWYATAISDGETYIYEDKRTGLAFTCYGSLPDSDEIEHVEKYHAGGYCPLTSTNGRVSRCADYVENRVRTPICYERSQAGKW